MLQRCACNAYNVEANNATYVRDGHPLCNEATCQKVREHTNLRRAPHFDDIEHEQHFVVNHKGKLVPHDHPDDCYVPEPYARSNRYSDI